MVMQRQAPVLRMLENGNRKTEVLSKTLIVEATVKQFPEGETKFGVLRVAAPSGNSGTVYLKSDNTDTVEGFGIKAGDSKMLMVTELSGLYYIGTADDTPEIFSEIYTRGK